MAGTGLTIGLAGPDDPRGGSDPRNLVNRITDNRRNGLQIEQTTGARDVAHAKIAAAVALAYRAVLEATRP